MWHIICQFSILLDNLHGMKQFRSGSRCVWWVTWESIFGKLISAFGVWTMSDMQDDMMDNGLLTQHYTLLITLSAKGWKRSNSTKMRRSRGGGRWRKKRKGEWRQKRRVRKPQITIINHQAVNIFTCYDGLLLAAAWDVCVQGIFCACLLCLAHPELLSLSYCLRLSLNWQHKQQHLRNHLRQQEAGRCANSPSTKLGCARLQKRLGSLSPLFNHKHLHGPGWKHTLGFSQGFALDPVRAFGSSTQTGEPNWDLCVFLRFK